MTAQRRNTSGRARPGHPHTPPIEWAAALVSTVLVLFLLGYTVREALVREKRPPLVAVRADSILTVPGGHVVMFTARNSGGETAAALVVRGTLRRGDAEVEQSEATIDYVPLGGERQGGLQFTLDPRRHTLEIGASGFDTP